MTSERPLIYKEITEVYIVNHEKFFTKEEAEAYIEKLKLKSNAK